jgi:chromosome segregation protein
LHFARLRLSGFKSFVEGAELALRPGLTGVVGPNGCGKSNLVEALRWVMGENSPRKMRGGEMDDVIFSGTAERPARNAAEVSLLLDNTDRDAPPAYNDAVEIEVQRRIAREEGSTYRINGREVRARDVQLLFADAASGAKSASLVGQGRIGELIGAKPEQRRHLLEEAAGITGLQSRRHEAELRLNAAEANLARLADVMDQLQAQLDSLKRQARQAARYRRLGERIRETEARLMERRWQAAEAASAAARGAASGAEAVVVARTEEAARAATAAAEAAADLPPARAAEAEAGAELHRLEVARVALDAEEERLNQQTREVEQLLARTASDMERERALAADAAAALARLEEERSALEAAAAGEEAALAETGAAREAAVAAVAGLEADASALAAERAAREARRASLARDVEAVESQAAEIAARLVDVGREIEETGRRAVEPARREAAALAEAEAERAFLDGGRAAEAAARRRAEAEDAEARARAPWQEAEARLARGRAEAAALAELLGRPHAAGHAPVLDAVTVEPGCELALGAALGDDLDAPVDAGVGGWRTLPPLDPPPPLPAGVAPLRTVVRGPAALARRLSQVGLVEGAAGDRLALLLLPGQRLVSREGDLWRWDGFTVRAGAETAAATRLRQRNRLVDLGAEVVDLAAEVADLAAALAGAQADHRAAIAADSAAREGLRRAESALAAARAARAAIEAEAQAVATRRESLEERRSRLEAEAAALARRRSEAAAALAGLAPAEEGEAELARLGAALAAARRELAERMSAHAILERTARDRAERLAQVASEREAWRSRASGAAGRLEDLAAREERAEAERAALALRPAEIAAQRGRLLDALGAAEARRAAASDARATAEERLAEADRAARAAERSLAESREEMVRRRAALEQAEAQRRGLAIAIAERLNVAPERLAELIGEDEEAGDAAAAEASAAELAATLQRLQRERDAIGPVNLRAEIEAQEVEQQHGVMTAERADLEAAIARLRRGIAELNREGRERLMAAFNVIDGHFRSLFARLFGGGEAHLALIGSEDPLEAGLEIVASPPGKKLQTLTLLSGGEQALTALALIFAQFLTNPSPVCVLDEVDAPLDDANVERFCNLLAEMVRGGETRFLVITHHPMTMARMDRLFGVTMAERGVSQLVSVDLATAEGLRATA